MSSYRIRTWLFQSAWRITLFYLFFAGLWIFLSDSLLGIFSTDVRIVTQLQIYKGWAFVSITAVGLYLIFSLHTKSEAKCSIAEARYRPLFNHMLFGLALHEIIWDHAGNPIDYRFMEVNQAFESITGLCPDNVLGKTVREVLPDTDSSLIERYADVAITGEPTSFSVYSQDLDRHFDVASYCPAPGQFVAIFSDITHRKRAEEKLCQSEADLTEAQRAAKLGNWRFHLISGTVTWSEELYRIFEFEKTGSPFMYDSFLNYVHPDDKPYVMEKNSIVLAKGEPFEIEYRIVTRAGQLKYIREIGYATKDAAGNIIGSFGTAQDITDYRRALEKIERQVLSLNALRQIDQSIINSTDPRVTLKNIVQTVATVLKVDATDVLLLNPHTLTLEYAAGYGFHNKDIERTCLKLGEGCAGRAALNREMVVIDDIQQTQGQQFFQTGQLAAENFTCYWGIPLVVKGHVKGVLEIFTTTNHEHDTDWKESLEILAGQCAIAIDSANMFKDLHHSHAELRLAYEATIEGWSRAMDLRDKETEGHTRRVTELS